MSIEPTYSCALHSSGRLTLVLSGDWTLEARLPPDLSRFTGALSNTVTSLSFDCTTLERWDTYLLVFLRQLIQICRKQDIQVTYAALPSGVQRLLILSSRGDVHRQPAESSSRSLVTQAGLLTIDLVHKGKAFVAFIGEIIIACFALLRGKSPFRWRDFFYFVQAAGAEALPIVSLISILVGIILAFVGAVQLQMFGAQIYVANLVGLAMVMEMGAMMSGIIMAGRTGAAYAAQLGTMQVNEEIDALLTLGISPVGFLVLPRMLALMFMMPLLCIYADILGIIGGAVIGVFMLDLSVTEYMLYTQKAITTNQCLQGVLKSCVYGVLVGYAGCLRGLQCGRSASAVGEAATSAVVTAIVLIIVSDALINFIIHS